MSILKMGPIWFKVAFVTPLKIANARIFMPDSLLIWR